MEEQSEENEKRFIPNQFKQVRTGKKNMGLTKVRIGKKVHRNEYCPCGKKVGKLYSTMVGEQLIPTPVKYKNCCLKH